MATHKITENIGPYVVKSHIKESDLTIISKGTCKYTNEEVCIKSFDKFYLEANIDDLSLITNEINILKILKHKNILTLYQIYESPSYIHIITEILSGGNLFEKITTKKNFSEDEARDLISQIVDALLYMHSLSICHRDIKIENILFDKKLVPKLIDYGYGTFYKKGTKLNEAFGSPSYACPEMHLGKPYDPELADVWSLGVVLYVIVCGYLPFCEEDEEKNKDLIVKGEFECPKEMSEDLKDLLKNMICVDESKRFNFDKVIHHQWFEKAPSPPFIVGGVNIYSMNYPIDERVINISIIYGFDKQKIREDLKNNKYSDCTSVYKQVVKKVYDMGMTSSSDLCSTDYKMYKRQKGVYIAKDQAEKNLNNFLEQMFKRMDIIKKVEEDQEKKEKEAIDALDKLKEEWLKKGKDDKKENKPEEKKEEEKKEEEKKEEEKKEEPKPEEKKEDKRFKKFKVSEGDKENELYLKKANPNRRNANLNKEDIDKVVKKFLEEKVEEENDDSGSDSATEKEEKKSQDSSKKEESKKYDTESKEKKDTPKEESKQPVPVPVPAESKESVSSKVAEPEPQKVIEEKKEVPTSIEEKKEPLKSVGEKAIEEKKEQPKPVEEKKEPPKPIEEKKEPPKPVEEKKEPPKPVEEKKESPKPIEEKKEPPKPIEEKKETPKPVEIKSEPPKSIEEKKEPPKPIEEKKESPKLVEVKTEPPKPVGSKEVPSQTVEEKKEALKTAEKKKESPKPVEVKREPPKPVEKKKEPPKPVETKKEAPKAAKQSVTELKVKEEPKVVEESKSKEEKKKPLEEPKQKNRDSSRLAMKSSKKEDSQNEENDKLRKSIQESQGVGTEKVKAKARASARLSKNIPSQIVRKSLSKASEEKEEVQVVPDTEVKDTEKPRASLRSSRKLNAKKEKPAAEEKQSLETIEEVKPAEVREKKKDTSVKSSQKKLPITSKRSSKAPSKTPTPQDLEVAEPLVLLEDKIQAEPIRERESVRLKKRLSKKEDPLRKSESKPFSSEGSQLEEEQPEPAVEIGVQSIKPQKLRASYMAPQKAAENSSEEKEIKVENELEEQPKSIPKPSRPRPSKEPLIKRASKAEESDKVENKDEDNNLFWEAEEPIEHSKTAKKKGSISKYYSKELDNEKQEAEVIKENPVRKSKLKSKKTVLSNRNLDFILSRKVPSPKKEEPPKEEESPKEEKVLNEEEEVKPLSFQNFLKMSYRFSSSKASKPKAQKKKSKTNKYEDEKIEGNLIKSEIIQKSITNSNNLQRRNSPQVKKEDSNRAEKRNHPLNKNSSNQSRSKSRKKKQKEVDLRSSNDSLTTNLLTPPVPKKNPTTEILNKIKHTKYVSTGYTNKEKEAPVMHRNRIQKHDSLGMSLQKINSINESIDMTMKPKEDQKKISDSTPPKYFSNEINNFPISPIVPQNDVEESNIDPLEEFLSNKVRQHNYNNSKVKSTKAIIKPLENIIIQNVMNYKKRGPSVERRNNHINSQPSCHNRKKNIVRSVEGERFKGFINKRNELREQPSYNEFYKQYSSSLQKCTKNDKYMKYVTRIDGKPIPEKKEKRDYPRPYDGPIDLSCISPWSIEESVHKLKKRFSSNGQKTKRRGRWKFFTKNYSVEIRIIQSNIVYYLTTFKIGDEFQEYKECFGK